MVAKDFGQLDQSHIAVCEWSLYINIAGDKIKGRVANV